MASQTASPHEAEVARQKLKALDANPMAAPPRPRPLTITIVNGVPIFTVATDVTHDYAAAAREYNASMEEMLRVMREQRRAYERWQEEIFVNGFTAAKRKAAGKTEPERDSEWGKPRPGVKYPRGGRQ